MCEICVLLFTVQLNPIFLPDICSVHLLIRAALLYHLIIWEAELQSDIFQHVKHLHSISTYLASL